MIKRIILIYIAILFLSPSAHAQEAAVAKDDVLLPRFVSIKQEKVFARTGPALRYPIRWVYQRSGMPVEIIQEFDSWRKIRDVDGDDGWVHQSMLSAERTFLVKAEDLVPLREGFSDNARMVAQLEPGVIGLLEKCDEDWCEVKAGGFHGWIKRNFIWGIYEGSKLN